MEKQPKLFQYLLGIRGKKDVAKLCSGGVPFVYTSGRYSSDHEKTSVVVSLGDHPEQAGSLIVYDLRVDPDEFKDLASNELADRIYVPRGSDLTRLPAKAMALNKAPAVAPVGVMDDASWKRIKLDVATIERNLGKLQAGDLPDRIKEAFSQKHKASQATFLTEESSVDSQLYDGFFNGGDKSKMASVRHADGDALADLNPDFADSRLTSLLPLYKARNFSKSMGS